jgi:hypothetical protein
MGPKPLKDRPSGPPPGDWPKPADLRPVSIADVRLTPEDWSAPPRRPRAYHRDRRRKPDKPAV